MDRANSVSVLRIEEEASRLLGLEVLRAVYIEEKRWAGDVESLLPARDLTDPGVCWLVARRAERPVGVVRVLYDLPLDLYRDYGMQFLEPAFDVERFLTSSRIAEVGRFAVVPEQRGQLLVAATLMREAARETVRRGFTHFITDVFEDDPHSPLQFHTRVLGFEPIATHDHGELAAKGRRITMLLDIARAYHRLRSRRSWIFRFIAEGWEEAQNPILQAGIG